MKEYTFISEETIDPESIISEDTPEDKKENNSLNLSFLSFKIKDTELAGILNSFNFNEQKIVYELILIRKFLPFLLNLNVKDDLIISDLCLHEGLEGLVNLKAPMRLIGVSIHKIESQRIWCSMSMVDI